MYQYIYLFRHGQSTFNKAQKFTGWLNPPLTKEGIKNAKSIANQLKNKKFQIAFHTSLKRSKQTLKEVLIHHPECQLVLQDDRMIERNYGLLNGTSHEKFIQKLGHKLLKLELEGDSYAEISKENKEKLEQFLGKEEYNIIHRGWNNPPPKGESFADVEKRVKPFIADIIKLIKQEKCSIAISAHGNSIRLFRKIMEKASVKETCSWFIPYDKVFIYKIKVE